MKKWAIVITLVLLFGAGVPVYLFLTSEKELTEEELKQAEKTISEAISADELRQFDEEGKNPFGNTDKQNELSDSQYINYIHHMSHQKVKASKKWTFVEMHPDRVEWLLEGLDMNDLKHEAVYRDILSRWKKEDFSSADEDHNKVWILLDGNVGKANGILSPAEEAAYIQKNK